jgi:hypothetical protein
MGCTTQTCGVAQRNWFNIPTVYGTKVLSIDITNDQNIDIGFKFTEQDLIKNFNFHKQVPKNNFWNSQGNRNIAWFYAHLRMLNFYLYYPNFEYYWFIDDDICMKDWDTFFKGTQSSNSDFLSYFCFKQDTKNKQQLVPLIDSNTYSGLSWFNRFPGDDTVMPSDITSYFGSFFPTTRFSNLALKTLLECHKQGFYGYHEGLVPTLLNYKNLQLQTIIKPDNTSDLFDVNEVDILHKGTKIEWSWI